MVTRVNWQYLRLPVCLSYSLYSHVSLCRSVCQTFCLCVRCLFVCACVRLSVWHRLSAGQCFNGGPCHISLGLSYWVPLHLSTDCCHQKLPSGNADHFLDPSLNSSQRLCFLLRTAVTSDGDVHKNWRRRDSHLTMYSNCVSGGKLSFWRAEIRSKDKNM